ARSWDIRRLARTGHQSPRGLAAGPPQSLPASALDGARCSSACLRSVSLTLASVASPYLKRYLKPLLKLTTFTLGTRRAFPTDRSRFKRLPGTPARLLISLSSKVRSCW